MHVHVRWACAWAWAAQLEVGDLTVSVSRPSALHCHPCPTHTHCSPGNVPNPTPRTLMSTPLLKTGQPSIYHHQHKAFRSKSHTSHTGLKLNKRNHSVRPAPLLSVAPVHRPQVLAGAGAASAANFPLTQRRSFLCQWYVYVCVAQESVRKVGSAGRPFWRLASRAFALVRHIINSLSSLLPWGKAGVVASGMLVLDCVLHGLVLFITVIVCNL